MTEGMEEKTINGSMHCDCHNEPEEKPRPKEFEVLL
jgi:hypothetical protein